MPLLSLMSVWGPSSNFAPAPPVNFDLFPPRHVCTLCVYKKWEGVFVPVVPLTLMDVLDSPVPALVGVQAPFDPLSYALDGVCVLDLDARQSSVRWLGSVRSGVWQLQRELHARRCNWYSVETTNDTPSYIRPLCLFVFAVQGPAVNARNRREAARTGGRRERAEEGQHLEGQQGSRRRNLGGSWTHQPLSSVHDLNHPPCSSCCCPRIL